ncbi:helix-turn-helix transcriptional regulator [Oerskovia enterophila]|uniref:helix-turn-helix transcriptional regulator n=1 Tax=Oerskovia enterophila TaxID=43678 RepID=UPI003393A2A7
MENHVRTRRAALGLTQAELAERVGVSRQTVISIERGRFDPSLPLAFRLSALLGASIEELFVPADHDVRTDPL